MLKYALIGAMLFSVMISKDPESKWILIIYSKVDFSVTNSTRSSYFNTHIISLNSPLKFFTYSKTILNIDFFIIDLSSIFENLKSSIYI